MECGEWSASHPEKEPPKEGSVFLRTGQAVAKIKTAILCSYRESNLGRPVHCLVITLTEVVTHHSDAF
jgi:hypothetical protein